MSSDGYSQYSGREYLSASLPGNQSTRIAVPVPSPLADPNAQPAHAQVPAQRRRQHRHQQARQPSQQQQLQQQQQHHQPSQHQPPQHHQPPQQQRHQQTSQEQQRLVPSLNATTPSRTQQHMDGSNAGPRPRPRARGVPPKITLARVAPDAFFDSDDGSDDGLLEPGNMLAESALDPSIFGSHLEVGCELPNQTLSILTSDGLVVAIPYAAARLSTFVMENHPQLYSLAGFSRNPAPVPVSTQLAGGMSLAASVTAEQQLAVPVHSTALAHVVQYMEYRSTHAGDTAAFEAWEVEFANQRLAQSATFFLTQLLAAHHLGVASFITLFCNTFCKRLHTLDSEQLRTTLGRLEATPEPQPLSRAASAGNTDSEDEFVVIDEAEARPANRRLKVPQRAAMSDASATNCSHCQKEFTILFRRHHCRICYDVFCFRCTEDRIELTEQEREEAETRIGVGVGTKLKNMAENLVTGKPVAGSKICCLCAVEQYADKKVQVLAEAFKLMKLELPDLIKIKDVNKSWSWAADLCLDGICRLQHCLPTHEFTEHERTLLWLNREHMSGHSSWLVQLMKIIDWSNRQHCEEAHRLLLAPRKHPCSITRCNVETCHSVLSPEDALALIGPVCPVLEPKVRSVAVEALSRDTPERLCHFIPVLVFALRDDKAPQRAPLFKLLLQTSLCSESFRSDLYWHLVVSTHDTVHGTMYARLKDRLILSTASELGEDVAAKLVDAQQLVDVLRDLKHRHDQADAQAWLAECIQDRELFRDNQRLPLPLDVSFSVSGIDTGNIRRLRSAVRPFVVPFVGHHIQQNQHHKHNKSQGQQQRQQQQQPQAEVQEQQDSGRDDVSGQGVTTEVTAEREGAGSTCAGTCPDEQPQAEATETGEETVERQQQVKGGKQAEKAASSEPAGSAGSDPPSPASPLPPPLGPPTTIKALFKNEDLRKDAVVMKIIRLMDDCLKRNDLDLHILTYNVVPTSPDEGLLQFVPNAVTLDYIAKAKHYRTIQSYLSNHNLDKTFLECQGTFMKSVAAYTVITFLLGVGDRHMENMMVKEDGVFFHIDYGFLLGADPKPLLCSKLALHRDMLDAMGGEGNTLHKQFKTVAAQAYNCLRKHAALFINMLLLLPKCSPPVELQAKKGERGALELELIQRFAVGKSDEEAAKMLHYWMDGDVESFRRSLQDFFHDVPRHAEQYGLQASEGASAAVQVAKTAVQYVTRAVQGTATQIAATSGVIFTEGLQMAHTLVGDND